MPENLLSYALLAALAAALLIAAITDIRTRRIANRLNATIALGAPLFWWACGLQLWPAIAVQMGVALASLFVLTALFALRMIGGGDVKLLTALALWIAPSLFAKLVVVMALFGGALTLALLVWRVFARRRADHPPGQGRTSGVTVPYGVAISLAGLWVIAADYLPAAEVSGIVG